MKINRVYHTSILQLLIRLEHLFAPGEDNDDLSSPVYVSLEKLLSEDEGYGLGKVVRVEETLLAANQLKSTDAQIIDFEVKMSPFEIRTFLVTLDK